MYNHLVLANVNNSFGLKDRELLPRTFGCTLEILDYDNALLERGSPLLRICIESIDKMIPSAGSFMLSQPMRNHRLSPVASQSVCEVHPEVFLNAESSSISYSLSTGNNTLS